MFQDIEEFGYNHDFEIESGIEESSSHHVEKFFPTDADLNDDEPQRKPVPKRFKSNNYLHFNDDAINWYLRVNLDGEGCASKSRKDIEQDESLEDTIRKVQLLKSFSSMKTDGICEQTGLFDNNSNCGQAKVFKYPPRNSGCWMAVTSLDGCRYYILTKSEQQNNLKYRPNFSDCSRLIQNFSETFNRAEKLNEAKRPEFIPTNAEPLMEIEDRIVNESVLWVDKYRAKYYTDLLSDDGINRTLLTWLKLWDECVFKVVKPKHCQRKVHETQNNRSKGFDKNRFNKHDVCDELSTILDQYKRPQNPVTLLCGPPGVGKTTLAHICASSCGYFVHEMNASDDRTLDAFRKQLENATQMTATLDCGSKPHCLIIDEIDGAPTPSIDYLVGLVKNAESNAKKVNKQIVRRPVICICNDLYAPALRELRKIALVLHVPSVDPRRLVQRLSWICNNEKVGCEPSVLEILCSNTECDVRSCINTLQFLAHQDESSKITVVDIKKSDVGIKDMHKSLFSVWCDVFALPKLKRKCNSDRLEELTNPTSLNTRFKTMLKLGETCGELDLINDGLFENYLNVNVKDSQLELIANGLYWLQTTDRLNRYIAENQSFQFWPYKLFVPVVFHFYFASTASYQKLQFPQSMTEAHFRMIKYISILQSLMNDINPKIRSGLCLTQLILEVLPFLLSIVQLDIRPVNAKLYSEKEREVLKRLVKTMVDFNLTYRQERSVDGQYSFAFEPPIEEIVRFSKVKSNPKQMSYVARQLVAREIEMMKVRSAEPDIVQRKDSVKVTTPQDVLANLKPKTFKPQQSKNFFEVKSKTCSLADVPLPKVAKVYFKFNEGSSNAIRRTVRIVDLL